MLRPRLLLAEDHREIAEGLRSLLETDFDVIAIVNDGNTLVSLAETLQPDVIVTDITMPTVDGIAATKRILERNPNARVVFVTCHGDPNLMHKALEVGGLAYILKTSAGEELIPAVYAALKGKGPDDDVKGF
jgi:DNA-binding NarL/FixJ family response regulator